MATILDRAGLEKENNQNVIIFPLPILKMEADNF